MAFMIKSVNGKSPAIEPDNYVVSLCDLYSDTTGRTAETGEMISYLIRSNIYKIELEYSGSASEIRNIRELLSSSNLSVEFLDLGEYITKKMYPSDRICNAVVCKNQKNNRYTLSLSLTEK